MNFASSLRMIRKCSKKIMRINRSQYYLALNAWREHEAKRLSRCLRNIRRKNFRWKWWDNSFFPGEWATCGRKLRKRRGKKIARNDAVDKRQARRSTVEYRANPLPFMKPRGKSVSKTDGLSLSLSPFSLLPFSQLRIPSNSFSQSTPPEHEL